MLFSVQPENRDRYGVNQGLFTLSAWEEQEEAMKVRRDFVTNSSSSSFILARREELTEKQKAAIIDFVEKRMLGEKLLTPQSTEEEISAVFEENYIGEEKQDRIRQALKAGKTVYSDWVEFECCENDYAEMMENLWDCLAETGKEDFEIIDGDLTY